MGRAKDSEGHSALYLAQNEPKVILTHDGGPSDDRVARPRKHRLLPEAVMFAVEGPNPDEGRRFEAFEEICADLRVIGIDVVAAADEQRIKTFATA